jgi:hypothetical protein
MCADASVLSGKVTTQAATTNVAPLGLRFVQNVIPITSGDSVVWSGGGKVHAVSSALPGTNGPLQLQFTSTTGINYVVEQIIALTHFDPVVTNSGSGGPIQFSGVNSSSTPKFIRVRLQ